MKPDERLQALRILTQLLDQKISLSQSMLKTPLTPLSQEICFGVCRHYGQLQAIAALFLKKRPKSTEVWLTLLIGLYQLHALRIPDYAVVQETVALLVKIKKIWAKGLVNAVLRTYCREQNTLPERLKHHSMYRYNHPDWFVKRIQSNWPHDWQTILKANDERPPMTLRVNSSQTDPAQYLAALKLENIEATPLQHAPSGLRLAAPCSVQALPGFDSGAVSVQDEAAQLAVTMLDLKPDLRLLDACCAPGGKTCHILETEPHLSACVALDIEDRRLNRVQDNLNRLKLHATLIQGDACRPEDWWDGILFDRILLDAPCSATGVIRRHPDIKLLRTEADLHAIVKRQHQLLTALWPLLATDGRLLYATCSIFPEENEAQIARFSRHQKDCEVLPIDSSWGRQTPHGRQILPGDANMDGFFYSLLKKSGTSAT